MNKPATDGRDAQPRWESAPHWYLWDGGYLLVGRGQGIVPPHQHHAIQVVIGIDGDIAISGEDGDWRTGRGAIVRQDVAHSYNPQGRLGAMVFVDPESTEGAWLQTSVREDITLVPAPRLDHCVVELRRFLDAPFESLGVRDLIKHCVQAMCTGAPPSRRLDPRVTKVLTAIRASDELRMSIEEAAALVFLSPSRFAHLFTQQLGLPFRRYMLWRKMTRAMLMIGREQTIAAAAAAADFADAAHLTRTFYQMVGLPPSVLMRGQFFEIPPPFESPDAPPKSG
ncbi:MAG TPA: AraC family transcriptional regulator [Vicinamibacterales bacterium]|nr:AraC family transcriptional regulator [Vicinamibacterales bacterium]